MRIFLLILSFLTIYILVEIFKFYRKVEISKVIILNSEKYELKTSNFEKKVLVLGDSSGYGVGTAKKEESVSGLLSENINATYLENLSVSGAQMKDLASQLDSRKLKNNKEDNYDIILIQIGGNDIIRFHAVEEQKKVFEKFLKTLPTYKKLIVISVGNVGDTTLFPFFIRPFHTNLSLKYHEMFAGVLDNQKTTNPNSYYINLYEQDKTKNLFLLQPEIYLSPDGLHPSSAGYKLWFEKVKENL